MRASFGCRGLEQEIAVALDDHHEVIEIVCDAPCEASHGLQASRAEHAFARQPQAFPHFLKGAGQFCDLVLTLHVNGKFEVAFFHLAAGHDQVFQGASNLARKDEAHESSRQHGNRAQAEQHAIQQAQEAGRLIVGFQAVQADGMVTRELDEAA